MKKTTKECYEKYMEYFKHVHSEEEQRNFEVRMAPVYYIIAPTSCNFGPPDTSTSVDTDPKNLQGIIIDPDNPKNLYLAATNEYVAGDFVIIFFFIFVLILRGVLQSKRMLHYNRYLCRTFYCIDEKQEDNKNLRVT